MPRNSAGLILRTARCFGTGGVNCQPMRKEYDTCNSSAVYGALFRAAVFPLRFLRIREQGRGLFLFAL